MEKIPLVGEHLPAVCTTCPAKTWVHEEGQYFCDSSVFILAKHHPNGGARIRPLGCPLVAGESSGKTMQLLRQILKR